MKIPQLVIMFLLVTCLSASTETSGDPGLPVAVQRVTLHLLKEDIQTLGEVKASQDIKVSSQYGGRIMRLNAPLGAYVKQHDVVASIRKKEAEALHNLHPIKDLKIPAPISGYVVERYVVTGEIAGAGQPLVRIISAQNPFISITIPGNLLHRVRKGTLLTITENGNSYAAEIATVVPVTDPVSGTFQVIAPLKTADLYPGAVCRVAIHLAEKTVPAVPRTAILTQEGQQIVFVVSAGRAERRVVTTGVRTDELIEVKKGLEIGESVVVVGNYELSDGVAVRVKNR